MDDNAPRISGIDDGSSEDNVGFSDSLHKEDIPETDLPKDVPPSQSSDNGAVRQPGFAADSPERGGNIARSVPQGHLWIVSVVVIAALLIAVLVAISSCSNTVTNALYATGLVSSPSGYTSDGTDKIAVISIDSSIAFDGTVCSPEGLKEQLDVAEEANDIQGVILRVNSGGGTATAGEEMASYVAEFSKPIVVVSEATNASAAYEISSQADHIFVARTTSIGSIGVVMQITDVSDLYDMLGINVESIKSSESKDSSYGYRPLTDEERAWYQDIVDQINEDFISTVADGRNMTVDEVRSLANGLSYTGMDAVENGLADEIGYFDDALEYISREAGFSEALPTVELRGATAATTVSILDLIGEDNVELQGILEEELSGS